MKHYSAYQRGFFPYALAALLIGLVGGFSTVLGPAFVQDLGIDYSSTTWTALAQAMSTAACAPISGRLGDLLGRRRTLLLGIATFTLGNLLTALSNSLTAMLIARFVVGIGTAAMAPVILAYIVTEFPPEQTARGFSQYMLISSASVVMGPSIGSLLLSSWGWRGMIWVCTAISLAILLICLFVGRQPEPPGQALDQFDTIGAILVVICFSLVLCIPAVGQNIGWHALPFRLVLCAATVSLAGLILRERRARSPILPGGLLIRAPFFLSILTLFFTQGLMQANMTNTIVFVNYTSPGSAVSGYAISILYLGMSLGAVLLGPLADRMEPKTVLTGSLLLTGVGCGLPFLFSADSSPVLLMLSLGCLGLGLGGNGTILMKVALSGLPPQKAGQGTGVYGLFRDLAAPFGVAVFVPMFTNDAAARIAAGTVPAAAAVHAMHMLAAVQLLCIAAGLVTVRFFPRIHPSSHR